MGHAEPFAFTDDYAPAPGIDRFLAGTPPILSLAALEGGLDAFEGVTDGAALDQVARDVRRLPRADGAALPRARLHHARASPEQRGSHISFAHPNAFEICQALIAAEVIGDFRAPDVIRFGLTPLYLGFEDIWTGVDRLAAILDERKLARSPLRGARQGRPEARFALVRRPPAPL